MSGARAGTRLLRIAGVLPLMTIAGCDSSIAPPRLKESGNAAIVRSTSIVIEPQWDSFSADVTIRINGGGPPGRPMPERRLSYRTERVLESNGLWSTSITPTDLSAGSTRRFSVSKVVTGTDGTVTLYDQQGVGRTWTATSAARDTSPPPQRGRRLQPVDPRGWLENIVVEPADRGRRLQRMRELHGQPENRDGLELYRSERNGKTTEAIVDPALGVVVEYRSRRGSADAGRSTFSYREVSPGVFLQTSSRDELPADTRRSAMTVDREFSNVRFERRGGR